MELEDEIMKSKTLEIPLSEYEVKWKFKGYFPINCKRTPGCHTKEMKFLRSKELDMNNWSVFRTYISKEGPECSDQARNL